MQTTFKGFTTCERCIYGRNLLGGDYGCRSEKRKAENLKLVNKKDYSCEYAEVKEWLNI